MELLLIRHGDAVDDAPGLGDAGRWLSGKGREVTRRVASWLAAHGTHRPAEIWTSPLVRAVQTAEIVADACLLTDEVSAYAALATHGDPHEVLRRVERRAVRAPLALVGHEPSLSVLAGLLLGDVGWPGFKKSGVLGVTLREGHHAAFRFVLHPKDLSVTTDLAKLRH